MSITQTIAKSLRAVLLTVALMAALSVPATTRAAGSYLCQFMSSTTSESGCFVSQSACDTAQGGGGSGMCDCRLDTETCPPEGSGADAGAAGAQPDRTKLANPLGTTNVNALVGRAINLFIGLSGTFALAAFVYGGFLMITSGGDPKKYASGLNSLKWAVLGLLVIFGSYAFLNTFLNALMGAGS